MARNIFTRTITYSTVKALVIDATDEETPFIAWREYTVEGKFEPSSKDFIDAVSDAVHAEDECYNFITNKLKLVSEKRQKYQYQWLT